jgi:hypothetical protein
MTFEKAKLEFQIRYYLWAISEFKKEINESFINFRSFKDGSPWKLYQFMQQLDRSDRLILAHSLLKRRHSDAAKVLGESLSEREESLLAQDREFNLKQSDLEVEFFKRRRAGEKIKFASKAKLRKVIKAKFKNTFGSQCIQCIESDYLANEPEPQFQMKCCGWIINTFFGFGRGESSIDYCHNIVSEDSVEHQGPKGIYRLPLVIGYYMSFCSWLGVTSQTQWEYLMDDDVEPACDAAIKFCGHFFEVAPKLLKGLEFEKITAD